MVSVDKTHVIIELYVKSDLSISTLKYIRVGVRPLERRYLRGEMNILCQGKKVERSNPPITQTCDYGGQRRR